MPLQIMKIYFDRDEKIRTNGYAWSWILLREGEKGEIHVSLSVQTRSSYTEHLSPSDYTIQIGNLIILFRSKNIAKKQHADVRAYPMDEDAIAMSNAPNNALIGQLIHQHPMGPIVWEQTPMSKMHIIVKTTS